MNQYPERVNNGSFLIPTGSIHAIDTLNRLSNNRTLVVATDKGYAHTHELQGLSDPTVVFHGSFSMMVNFHALCRYFKACGGDYHRQTSRHGISTVALCMGSQIKDLPETAQALDAYIERLGPGDFFNFHDHMKLSKEDGSLKIFLSHMQLCHWDPHVYRIYAPRINELMKNNPSSLARAGFSEGMSKLAEHFYFIPNCHDTFFDIAIFYHTLLDYKNAIKNYEQSITYFGPQFSSVYNAALCCYLSDDFSGALTQFAQAYEINPESEETKDWINRIKEETAQ